MFRIILLLCLSTYSLAQRNLPPIFQEEFSDNINGWPMGANAVIENGNYLLTAGTNTSRFLNRTTCINGYNDFVIEASFEQLDDATDLEYGIHWGNKAENGCSFLITAGGNFVISKLYNTNTQTFQEGTAEQIEEGKGALNVLRIERINGVMNFYINKRKVFTGEFIHNYCLNGLQIRGSGMIAVDYFRIYQNPLSIQVAQDISPDVVKERMSERINSNAVEINPIISHDGELLFFIRQNHPDNTGSDKSVDDIWYSERQADGTWGIAKNMGDPLNNDVNNGVFSVTADNNTLLLNNIYPTETEKAGKGFSTAVRTADGWSYPKPINVADYYNDDPFGEACLSANNKVLLFSANRKDSKGGRDLYASFYQNGINWSAPLSLGNINSFSDEASPFLAADGVTLYFASSGWPGYGNRDIFVTKRLDDSWTRWSTPINLGPKINTPNFDQLFRIDASGEFAVMSSSNPDTKEDIYLVRLHPPSDAKKEDVMPSTDAPSSQPDPVVFIRGKVLNAKNKYPVEASISYEQLSTAKEVGIASSNPATGEYKIVLAYGINYGFQAKAKGYISLHENIDLTKVDNYNEMNYDLYLVPIEVGQTINLNNIFFVRGKPELLRDSYPELDRLFEIMNENKSMEIGLAGHTDNQGDAKLNQLLSEQRVASVKAYLLKKGISEKRIAGKGYGGSRPVADNSKEESRRLNRRVELTITKK